MISCIVLAGGKGTRMGSETKKQYLELLGKPALSWSLLAFQNSMVDEIILVCSDEDREFCKKEIIEKYDINKCRKFVEGGAERYLSVYNGLKEVSGEYVMIHDGARPCITPDTINKAGEMLLSTGTCCVGTFVSDTIAVLGEDGTICNLPDRKTLWSSQTPQCFKTEEIIGSYDKALAAGENKITDDDFVAFKYGNAKIHVLDDGPDNIKLTTKKDILLAEGILKAQMRI